MIVLSRVVHPRRVLDAEDLGAANQAFQRQVSMCDGFLDGVNEAEATLTLMAARRDLHASLGLAANNALKMEGRRVK